MNNGLILDKDLRMTNLANLTEEKVKNLTREDLDLVLKNLDEGEKLLINKWIISLNNDRLTDKEKSKKYELIGQLIEIAVYRVMQGDL
jgi:hypothetical protein